jgi:hypothetical protein
VYYDIWGRIKVKKNNLAQANPFLWGLCLSGAGIFAGTYLTIGSFNYRLLFSLLCVPYLVSNKEWQQKVVAAGFVLFAAWPAIENNIFWYIPWTYVDERLVGLARQTLGLWLCMWAAMWLSRQLWAWWRGKEAAQATSF